MEEANILQSLGNFFKPEFLNRFDSIIEFSSLQKEDLLQIVDLMLQDLYTTLDEQHLTLQVTNEAKEKLAQLGYSPKFGARPLRRLIQEQLEDGIADFIFEQPEVKSFKAIVKNDQLQIVKA